ncbi:lysophospholipase [Reichenbachiella agarivorans]|uniref:Lysophospholipase n=1 Tax=Reichenbachiella agarivorans TaxID=2979464 RepID=A0ABY6CSM9_9BACT|nr:alpha/beta hydrolase [Reichenbachiella agarivorans]UXP33498.1 lysophospholipase [Reichenbachiella agarivorans]
MVDREEFSIVSRDGTQLAGYEYLVPQPKAMVCMIHGLGEHAGRYEHVAQFFCEHNISFYIIDMRGHGLSEGKRGHAPTYEALLDDVEELMMYARSEYNDLPMFLYGHSMGGNIVANYCLLRTTGELKGVVLSSPWFRLVAEPPTWKVNLAKRIATVLPSLTQPNNLNHQDLTHDKAVNQSYADDPMVHSKISVKLFSQCYQHSKWALENSDRLKTPIFSFHGADDPIVNPLGTEAFAESRPDLVRFVSLAETKHEPHNDLKQKEVLDLIIGWIETRVS